MSAALVEGLEGGKVDRAVLFPACCEICLGTQGPFWDTGVDRPIGPAGRGGDCHVYICRSCFRIGNLSMGYAKGEEMERLNEASDRLKDAETERDEAVEAAHKMATELTRLQQVKLGDDRQIETLRGERDLANYKIDQAVANLNEHRVSVA